METGNFERSSVHRADKAGFFLAVINDCGVAWCDQKPQRTPLGPLATTTKCRPLACAPNLGLA